MGKAGNVEGLGMEGGSETVEAGLVEKVGAKVGVKVGWVGEEGVGKADGGKGWGGEGGLNKSLFLWLEEMGLSQELRW